jgi:hypothetical protein
LLRNQQEGVQEPASTTTIHRIEPQRLPFEIDSAPSSRKLNMQGIGVSPIRPLSRRKVDTPNTTPSQQKFDGVWSIVSRVDSKRDSMTLDAVLSGMNERQEEDSNTSFPEFVGLSPPPPRSGKKLNVRGSSGTDFNPLSSTTGIPSVIGRRPAMTTALKQQSFRKSTVKPGDHVPIIFTMDSDRDVEIGVEVELLDDTPRSDSEAVMKALRVARFVSPPISVGIAPVRMLSWRVSLFNCSSRPISLGISPWIRLRAPFTLVRRVQAPISVGNVPVRKLSHKSTSLRSVYRPSSVGTCTLPTSSLLSALNCFMAVKSPSSVGRVPFINSIGPPLNSRRSKLLNRPISRGMVPMALTWSISRKI